MINDWIMRQIELMAQGLAKLFSIEQQNDSTIEQTVEDYVSKIIKNNLKEQLDMLVNQNKLCEAEDLLFACSEQFLPIDFEDVAMLMYDKMQNLSDETLSQASFPRNEIQKGIEDFQNTYDKKIASIN